MWKAILSLLACTAPLWQAVSRQLDGYRKESFVFSGLAGLHWAWSVLVQPFLQSESGEPHVTLDKPKLLSKGIWGQLGAAMSHPLITWPTLAASNPSPGALCPGDLGGTGLLTEPLRPVPGSLGSPLTPGKMSPAFHKYFSWNKLLTWME